MSKEKPVTISAEVYDEIVEHARRDAYTFAIEQLLPWANATAKDLYPLSGQQIIMQVMMHAAAMLRHHGVDQEQIDMAVNEDPNAGAS